MLSSPNSLQLPAIKSIVCAFISSIILLSVSNSCYAQDEVDTVISGPTDARLELGVSGGLSINKFSSGQPHTGTNTGFTSGLIITYHIYKQVSVQIEANYTQQGGQLLTFKDDTRFGLPESFSTKNVKNSSVYLNSLEIPLLIRYTFPVKKDWKPAFYVGGSYANNFIVVDRYQKTGILLPGEDVVATVSESQTVTSQYNKDRLNLVFGADLRLNLFSNVKLLLDFRYVAGLTPAKEHYSYMEKVGFGTDIRSNSFISKIGLILPL